jgi:hypothetical protein
VRKLPEPGFAGKLRVKEPVFADHAGFTGSDCAF